MAFFVHIVFEWWRLYDEQNKGCHNLNGKNLHLFHQDSTNHVFNKYIEAMDGNLT